MLVESTSVSLNWEISVSLHIFSLEDELLSGKHRSLDPRASRVNSLVLWVMIRRKWCGWILSRGLWLYWFGKLVGKRLHEKSSILVNQLNRRQFLCFAMTSLENHLSRTGVMWHWILVSRSLGVRIVTVNWIFEIVFSGIYFSKTWLLWH